MPCCVMLCYEECPVTDVHSVLRCVILRITQRTEINVTFYSATLARMIWLPDDGPRTETCRSVLMF